MATLQEMNPLSQVAEKPLSEVVRERRATPHFEPTPIPEADLRKILEAGMEAPSGYNLQPWRFVVVRDPETKKRLREAAMGQPRVEEAPVVVVACGDPKAWEGDLERMLKMGNEHGFPESANDGARKAVRTLLTGQGGTAAGIAADINLWLNRHVTIAYTTMLWMAEVLGYDTAPMEGFWEDKVRQVLDIPAHVRVVALLAIGRRKGNDKPYGGRFDFHCLACGDRWNAPLDL